MAMVIKLFNIYKKFQCELHRRGWTNALSRGPAWPGASTSSRKILELGQDPNVRVGDIGDSPLIMVLSNSWFAELLLRSGADPNLANAKGLTPLHYLSTLEEDDDWPNALFELSHDKYRPLQVNAKNNSGAVPLLYALKQVAEIDRDPAEARGQSKFTQPKRNDTSSLRLRSLGRCRLVKDVLRYQRRIASNAGWMPLHKLLDRRDCDKELLRLFFEINEAKRQPVRIDGCDKRWTPLHLAMIHGNRYAIDLLMRKSVDPNSAQEKESTSVLSRIRKSIEVDGELVDEFDDQNNLAPARKLRFNESSGKFGSESSQRQWNDSSARLQQERLLSTVGRLITPATT
ncbi:unnamed protein product [Trichogramma brassicae]|uniref:Uncharacterized protein n=1 Tax=Trichogramma brassicae TaxID=86971 RepID=A0A6H5HU00_9HYME|nr:unnamed protein product [Trichogramma brassicae]